jgi:Ca2+-binding RTX toxin-like protein
MELLGQGWLRGRTASRTRSDKVRSRRRVVSLTASVLAGTALTPLTAMAPAALAPTALLGPADAAVGQGFNLNPSDLKFILKQIRIAEHHASVFNADNPCAGLMGPGEFQIPTTAQGEELPWGLRTVDGTCNNLVPGQRRWGAADQPFPRSAGSDFRDAEPESANFPGNATSAGGNTSYARSGSVVDSEPRMISNMIVDQTEGNPAAAAAAGPDATPDGSGTLFIPNTAPDTGLSAPYNSWFTLFGQFFDHGLDLVNKGGSGTVFMPLDESDPLFDAAHPERNFMVVTRGSGSPGATINQTATFVDQSQTYTSHPSHQVFLREYDENAAGEPVSTGLMLEGTMANGTHAGMGTWASVKDQARDLLGIELDDQDVLNLPLLKTDPYGKFLPGPNGFPQLVLPGNGTLEGNPDAPVDASNAVETGHAFLDDIAHSAVPFGDHDHDPSTPRQAFTPDEGTVAGNAVTEPGVYDDELLDEHFVAGDGRVNENIGLTAVHHVFHAEHNRLAADPSSGGTGIKDVLVNEDPDSVSDWQIAPGVWDGERIFQAARFITEMEYQHLAFEEFVRKVQPMVNAFGEGGTGYNPSINPAIRAEFAHAVYRFGHSMLTETVARREANGVNADMPLLDAFLNPLAFDDAGTVDPGAAAGRVVRGMTRQTGNEIDEFVTEQLRNDLLGLPLDLPAINIARARETGVPRLNTVRSRFFAESNNSALAPYTSWTDFGLNLKNRDSLVNFVAAYGKHPSITGTPANRRAAATLLVEQGVGAPGNAADFMNSTGAWTPANSGLNDVDLWMGGLAEKRAVFGGLLGSTFNYVFEKQMEDLQFGDRFYYLSRTAGLNLLTQLEGNSFSELISRNTDVSGLPADAFSRPDYVFDVGTLTSGPGSAVADDPATDEDESDTTTEPGMHLSKMAGGPNRLRYTGPAHAVFNGTNGEDRVWASEGDDTIRGGDGADWMEGGDGVDNLIGGLDDDIMNDLFGDDTLKGGDGDDAMSSGQGFGGDLNQGGRGKDFIVNGNDITETFGGPGNDFVLGGDDTDTVFGDDGDDWIEGGTGPFNLLQGDNGAPFQDDPNKPGHDVFDGDGGEQDFDAEGGDDIMLGGPGIQRAEGMLGFDWFTHQGDAQPGRSDLEVIGALPPAPGTLRDRFDLTEALSGWEQDDILRGDSRSAVEGAEPEIAPIGAGHELEAPGIARISGLQAVVGAGVDHFDSGNIILGGDGSDILEGRGGDDILDGDKFVRVYLSVRTDPADPATETDRATSLTQLQTDVFSGLVDPGNIVIVREVADGTGVGTDQAQFSDVRLAYQCVDLSGATPEPLNRCPLEWDGGRLRVSHLATIGGDGSDIVENVEELVFSDSEPPEPPTDVQATPHNGAARVSFTPSDSVVNRYEIEVLNEAEEQVGTRLIANPQVTSFLVDGLTNGIAYHFRVRAINGFGTGEWSLPSSPVTPRAEVPARLALPTVDPGNESLRVTWSAPADDGGSPVTGYEVRVKNLADQVVTTMQTTTRAATVTGLQNGREYFTSVRALNVRGGGAWSIERQAIPAGRPGAPRLNGVDPRNRSVLVRWSAPADDGGSDITGYRVQVRTPAGRQVGALRRTDGVTHRLLVGRLDNGTTYTFRVRAVSSGGASAWSSAMRARPHR